MRLSSFPEKKSSLLFDVVRVFFKYTLIIKDKRGLFLIFVDLRI